MLQTQTVTEDTLVLIKRLMADSQLQDFLLVGGTALALNIGHRKSIDIDLFSRQSFDSKALGEWLRSRYAAQDIKTETNLVFCYINDIKTDILTHAYPEIEPCQTTEGIRMVSLADIAAMKLHAIHQNGSRLKDFVDVYFLLEKMPLERMYAAYEEKYSPNANAYFAHLALLDTSRVILSEKVYLFNHRLTWGVIKQRLQEALEFTQKIFPAMKQNRFRNDPPEKKRGFRM
ncbi:nucleotidyl transferase AbiEii/AbiGii toxin family protein [Niabella insulamsoli]|uniref:nucleotidyl transferase AbiEii/AbiGii toxin family protein n=1 Tax=Niabella insulamsoli TaxID=3144874 RepID=UPI0031FDFFB2